jgi:hypothetical protein
MGIGSDSIRKEGESEGDSHAGLPTCYKMNPLHELITNSDWEGRNRTMKVTIKLPPTLKNVTQTVNGSLVTRIYR